MEPLAGSKSPVEHSSLVGKAGPEKKRGAKDVHDSPLSLGTRGLIISACRQNSSSERRIKRAGRGEEEGFRMRRVGEKKEQVQSWEGSSREFKKLLGVPPSSWSKVLMDSWELDRITVPLGSKGRGL